MLIRSQPSAILSLSPRADDHDILANILEPDKWTVHRAATVPRATRLLERHSICVVICERDVPPHGWIDLIPYISAIPNPPALIVTSCHADDRLWVEALNLGAYDVLPKPFDAAEVRRILKNAALHWEGNRERASALLVRMAGASRASGTGHS